MKFNDYNNEFFRQIRTAPKTVKKMSEVITHELFSEIFPTATLRKTTNVILTGAGDSYFAGILAKPTFENIETDKGTGNQPGIKTEVERAVEFTRYYDTYREWWISDENNVIPLVLGVSISGSPTRLTEAMRRTNKYNGISVAFTNNEKSKFAEEAKYTVPLNAPLFEFAPAVTSYIASSYALTQFGLYYSMIKGKINQEQVNNQQKSLLAYVSKFTPELMEQIEQQAFEIAKKWIKEDIDNMDFIGDGPDYATAYFGSAKMVESFGGLSTYDDSENWNHINFFMKTPEKIGTFFVANKESPSLSRLKEDIVASVAIGRPTVVITDMDQKEFPKEAEVFTLPEGDYQWFNPIMQHIPISFIAAFIGAIKDIPWFVPDSPLHQLDKNHHRFKDSEIVII